MGDMNGVRDGKLMQRRSSGYKLTAKNQINCHSPV